MLYGDKGTRDVNNLKVGWAKFLYWEHRSVAQHNTAISLGWGKQKVRRQTGVYQNKTKSVILIIFFSNSHGGFPKADTRRG